MDIWNNELWRRLFGSAWKQITEADPKIGAFAALDDKRKIMLDPNAVKLLGFKHTPIYDEFMTVLDGIKRSDTGMLRLHMLEAGENITAGFLILEEDDVSLPPDAFPLPSQAQLLKLMSEDDGRSMLALIKLEGISDTAYSGVSVISALNAITDALPQRAVVASHAKRQFWIYVPHFDGDEIKLLTDVQNAVKCCKLTDEFGVVVSDRHTMTFSAGTAGISPVPAQRLHTASFALFEAEREGAGSICRFSSEHYELQKNEYQNIKLFSRLIDQNLFLYHFQPIVSASTGDIVAYEALMRTDESIGLNPLQILDLAEKFSRLYDIEKATLRNTLCFLSSNQEAFDKRKLFVNAITSQMLTEEDYAKLRSDYGELLEKVVIELTEQTEIPDEKLHHIHERLKRDNMLLAIDDYGTGYSNTSNLLRYNPDFVKIDRSLISHIDTNPKMQKIVSGIIEFLHASGYIALAEGVETSEELRTMIAFGADLIQGYYISRPKPVLLREISENIQQEIVRINLETGAHAQKIYRPAENETVDLNKLATDKYTIMIIDVSAVTLSGKTDKTVPMTVEVKDGTDTKITLKNAGLLSPTDNPVIRIGSKCNASIICEGDSRLELKGIYVPRNSSLCISGAGSLSINSESANCFAIGCDCDHTCGSITVDMSGNLDISLNGERCVGIGGGKNSENNTIRILGGEIAVSCEGGNCVGIGIFSGGAVVEMSDCSCKVKTASSNAAAIGSISGETNISLSNFYFECECSGANQTAIGSISDGAGKIALKNGRTNITMKGKNLSCIGSRGGATDCFVDNTAVTLYCEGGSISGIGDKTGGGNVAVTDSSLDITFLTGDGMGLGSPAGTLSVVRGVNSIKINE